MMTDLSRLRVCVAMVVAGLLPAVNPAAAFADESLAFRLADTKGDPVEVTVQDEPCLTVVCFLGTECPMARLYGPRLSKMAAEFQDQGVRFIGVNSNRQDSVADIREYVRSYSVTFPVLKDPQNRVADQFGAQRTPEVFVLDESLNVIYHGRIDDQYAPGINRGKPQRRDLHNAISQWLAGDTITVTETEATGCLIGRVPKQAEPVSNGITYAEHVVPVLHRHCVECHRDGEIGPFAMDDYDEVAGWAETMLETIEDGRMPPWHADPRYGHFQNERRMPEEDRQVLRDWIAGGLAPGDLSKVPELPEVVTGWQMIREPDMVLEMRRRPFTVPADGTVEYQYFVVDPGFKEDKWIIDARTLPGNRAVVHHIIVYIRPPELSQFRGIGWLTAYVPGARPVRLPEGFARFVPAGSKFVFQMHYTPNGEQQDDLSKLGLIFTDASKVTHEVFTIAGVDQEFEIPPGHPNFLVHSEVRRLPKNSQLLGIAPHMHYRGKSFTLWDGYGDDAAILLHVPNYDFNWQHVYQLKDPLPLDEVEQLRFTVAFDNSADNPFNPDPTQWVTWGDQSWEEMAIGFFDVAVPRGSIEFRDTSVAKSDSQGPTREEQINSYIERFFTSLDRNGDRRVTRSEAPIIVRRVRFHQYDRNQDGYVSADEVRRIAEELFPESTAN